MPTFIVELQGDLTPLHRSRLSDAGLVVESSGAGTDGDALVNGPSIHSIIALGATGSQAMERVADALAVSAGDFGNWRARPA